MGGKQILKKRQVQGLGWTLRQRQVPIEKIEGPEQAGAQNLRSEISGRDRFFHGDPAERNAGKRERGRRGTARLSASGP